MSINKESLTFDMPWENAHGYYQAVKVGNVLYVAGQLSHDKEANIVGDDMVSQMRKVYENTKEVLEHFGADFSNIVDEMMFATDIEAAKAARYQLKDEVFGGKPVLCSTIVEVCRLSDPKWLLEVKYVAYL